MRREYESCAGLAYLLLTTAQRFAPFTYPIRGDRVWCYISDVFVPAQQRRRGHARDMLRRCLADADAQGVSLWLIAAPTRPWDLGWVAAFYARNGFQVTDVTDVTVPPDMQRKSMAMWRWPGGASEVRAAHAGA